MKRLLLFFLSFFAMSHAKATEALPYPFGDDKSYSTFRNIRLSSDANYVNLVYQDRQGLMWLGTKQGLYSYNGYNIHRYLNCDKPAANHVQGIVQTDNEHLCVGTFAGIMWLNLKTGQAEKLHHALNRIRNVRTLKIYAGHLWIGTNDEGLFYYDLKTGRLRHSVIPKYKETGVYAIEPAGNQIFIGAYEGLSVIDLTTMRGRHIPTGNNKSSFVNSLLWNCKSHCVLVGTEGYLYKYDTSTGRVTPLPLLRGNVFKTLANDTHGNLLMGTDAGLYLYNTTSGTVRRFLHDTRNVQSICNNIIWNITRDRNSNIWLATDHGVAVTQYSSWYRQVNLSEFSGTGEGNIFTQLMTDSQGRLWMGGENGLLCVIPAKGTWSMNWYNANNPEYHLVHNRIRHIYEDRDHDIWIATDASIARYDATSHRFVYYTIKSSKGDNANWTYGLYEDPLGRLWIITYAGEIFIVDKKDLIKNGGDKVYIARQVCTPFNYRRDKRTLQIEPDGEGHVWLCSKTHLAMVDLRTLKMKQTSMRMDRIMYCDHAIWLADQTSIYKYDIPTGRKIRVNFNMSGGTVNAFVRQGRNIWFSCADGIFRIDTRNGIVSSVNMPNGNYLAGCYNERSGEIMWGGEDCIVSYSLHKPARQLGKVCITSVIMEGRLASKSGLMKSDMPLFTHKIELAGDRNVTLELSTLSYYPQQDEVFYYQLGDDEAWHSLRPGQNQISFANLPSGTYRLRICATNPMTDPHARTNAYIIVVPRSWYASYPAIIVYFLILASSILAVFRYQQHRNRLHYEQHEKEKSLELSRLKMDFFVNMSHELKTPLSLIIAPLSKLIPEISNARQKQSLVSVQRNALRLNTLIYKILNFKQVEYEGDDTLIRSHVEMCQLIRNCIQTFNEAVVEKHIHIDFTTGSDELWLNIDMLKIESVLINLISNAVKYVDECTGKINISLDTGDNNVRIIVADNGTGIDDDDMRMVFIRFFQGRNAAATKGGTGIGLYLVKKYVELHGGTVDIQSYGGTTFTINLPLSADNAPSQKAEYTSSQQQPDNTRETILIIDDNREIVDFLAMSLSEEYNCVCAYNGKEGLDKTEHALPDLIIVDQMMPEMNGFEFCREIKHRQPTATVPIIMLTAQYDMQTELQSIKIGIDVFISKPFDMKKIQLQIVRLIQNHRNMQRAANISNITNPEFHTATDKPSPDERLIEDVTHVVEENMEDEEFNVTQLASKTGIDQKQLYRKVKQLTGITPVAYVKKLRLKKAATLLRERKFAVSEVMYLVGFNNASYFTKCFSEEFGMSPRQYMEQNND